MFNCRLDRVRRAASDYAVSWRLPCVVSWLLARLPGAASSDAESWVPGGPPQRIGTTCTSRPPGAVGMRVSRRWAACHAALKTKRQHRRVDWLNWALPTPVTP